MIPPVFYHAWFGDLPSIRERRCRQSVLDLHPDWHSVIVSDSIPDDFEQDGEILPLSVLWGNERLKSLGVNLPCFFNRIIEGYRGTKNRHAIAADFIRVCSLYAFGGFSLDWDIYAVQPFDRFRSDDIVFAKIRDSLASEAVIGAREGDERLADIIVRYVTTQTPESGVCCLNLSGFTDERQLPAYSAEWFIPHRRQDQASKLYDHTSQTHSIHLWREHEYDFAKLEAIRDELRGLEQVKPSERSGCGCTRSKG